MTEELKATPVGTDQYELTFIVGESSTDDSVKKIIHQENISVTKEQDLSVREFAYPIQKTTRGHYFCIHFEIAPINLPGFERSLKADKQIIRYLIVKALRADQTSPTKPLKREQTPKPESKLQPKIAAAPKVEPAKTEAPTLGVAKESMISTTEIAKDQKEPISTAAKATVAPAKEEKTAEAKKDKAAETTLKPKRKTAKPKKVEASELDQKLKELVEE